ncbi:MAG TPA: GFA family protein [Polyangiaceae bacterium]|nr:GFA family protein [Polyangiaceae bacterium]
MADPKTHSGGCHCGKVRFEVQLDLGEPAITCNCSICGKTGAMLRFVPADQFTLKSGEDALTDYLFNKKQIHHLFCSVCGVRPFARGSDPKGNDMRAINVRCLDDVELGSIPTHAVDGRSF